MQFKFFPAILASPKKIKFDKQEENEVIELFLRQHPIVNFGWIFISLFLLILPPLFLQFEGQLGLNFTGNISLSVLIGGLIVYYLLIAAYAFEQFLSWYYNVYIVTNMHIVDINFYSLLSKEVVEISLNDIEVIAYHASGVLASLYHYGNVEIETAAETKRILFEKVPNPDVVTDAIQDLQRARKSFGGGH